MSMTEEKLITLQIYVTTEEYLKLIADKKYSHYRSWKEWMLSKLPDANKLS